MTRCLAPFVLLIALPLFGYEVASPLHRFSVNVVRMEAEVRYVVRVIGVGADVPLAADVLAGAPGEQVTKTFDAGGRTLRVSVHELEGTLTADLTVERDATLIDSMCATWLTETRQRLAGGAPLRVGGDVRAPVVVKRVPPRFPNEAKVNRISGIVILELVIDRTGKVTDARVLKPLPFGLDEAAVEAVRQWEFQPGTLNGEPVDVIFNITIAFQPDA